MNRTRKGQTLVATLAVIAIICVLAAIYLGNNSGAKSAKPDGRGTTTLGAAKASAEDIVCKNNISQTRQLLQVARTSDEEFKPASVAEIPGAGSVSKCPVGKEPYIFDASGEIKCPHVGHEKY
jgi:hypothetical protein